MKLLTILFALIFTTSLSYSQAVQVEKFNISQYGSTPYQFIDAQDRLVLSTSNGIHIFQDDTVLVDKIDSSGVRAFRGRFGNIIFQYGNHAFKSWKDGSEYIFYGDSSINLNEVYQAMQLYNGKIICISGQIPTHVVLFDSAGSQILPAGYNMVLPKTLGNFVEIDSNLIYTRISALEDVLYYEPSSGNYRIFKDTALVPYTFSNTWTKGLGRSVNVFYSLGVINMLDTVINSILYYAGFPFFYNPNYFSSGAFIDNMLVIANKEHFVMVENGNITAFDTSDGYNASPNSGILTYNSKKQIYGIGGLFLYKITSPISTSISETASSTQYRIYPNPIDDYFIIQCNESLKIDLLRIYDINGNCIQTQILNKSESQHRIQLNPVPAQGIYFLTGYNGEVPVMRSKLIKY